MSGSMESAGSMERRDTLLQGLMVCLFFSVRASQWGSQEAEMQGNHNTEFGQKSIAMHACIGHWQGHEEF